jgi:hypothetical protein
MGETAFVLSYFRQHREALHLAVSRDGRRWRALNGNAPVLSSPLRTRTMRDPFLFRDRDGRFHLLSTDGWTSLFVIHAVSDDLVRWRDIEALPVMVDVPGARNSWAPEAFLDREKGVYRLIWSSTVSLDGPDGLRDHRIWSCETPDFREFGPPSLFFDPEFNVIDATVRHHDGVYVMAFKDERGENRPDTPGKAIRLCTSTGGCRSFGPVSGLLTPSLSEGPILFRCRGRWMLFYDRYLEGAWGARASVDLEHWVTLARGVEFPDGARHGSVVEVEEDLLERLERRLG